MLIAMIDAMTTEVASPPAGLRERKKQQTRAALHRSALELVSANGVCQVTTEQIAERAGVSARTFFNYFPTKESAILGMGPDQAGRVAQWLRDEPAEVTPEEAVRSCFTRYALELAADKDLWKLRHSVVRSNPSITQAMAAISSAVERAVAEALAERMGVSPQDDLRPHLVVSVIWAAIRAGLAHSREHEVPVQEAIDETLGLFDDWAHTTAGPPIRSTS